MNIINKYRIACILMLAALLSPYSVVHGQSSASDSVSAPTDAHAPVYRVDYWVSVPIILVGGAGGLWLTAHPKDTISNVEFAAVNQSNVPSFDRLSLHQNIALVPQWDKYAQIGQIAGAAMPFLLLIDDDIRQDWLPVLTIGLEVNMVALGIYSLSPLGPTLSNQIPAISLLPASGCEGGRYRSGGW